MSKVTFVSPENQTFEVEAEIGKTLMQIAVDNNVDGIDADCGGACACATCHVIIPKDYIKATGPADEDESALLDFLDNRKSASRLSCQIEMTEDLDRMIIKVPALE